MQLPFTVEQFLDVFTRYNNAIWPGQILLFLAALTVVILAVRRHRHSDRTISAIMSLLWLWTGLVYHIGFFSVINPAAFGFGGFCVLQGALFGWLAVRGKVEYRASSGWRQLTGSALILYALLLYPLLGWQFGHTFPSSPTFGAPCPTTIFTFGVLLWAVNTPRFIIIIPFLWSLVGFTAALSLGVYEDIGLLVAGVIASIFVLTTKRSRSAEVLSAQ